MFWAFKLSFDVNIWAFGQPFSNNYAKFYSLFRSHCASDRSFQFLDQENEVVFDGR
jgi:hypothetical protein